MLLVLLQLFLAMLLDVPALPFASELKLLVLLLLLRLLLVPLLLMLAVLRLLLVPVSLCPTRMEQSRL